MLWQALSRLARKPDRFGVAFTRIARFVRDARCSDGGKALLGIDVRDLLWQQIELGLQPEYFIRCYIELDPDGYAE